MYGNLKAADLVEKIFAAHTLEEAIFWREEMVERLEYALSLNDSGLSADERDLYAGAKAQTERALDNLNIALVKGERWHWTKSSVRR